MLQPIVYRDHSSIHAASSSLLFPVQSDAGLLGQLEEQWLGSSQQGGGRVEFGHLAGVHHQNAVVVKDCVQAMGDCQQRAMPVIGIWIAHNQIRSLLKLGLAPTWSASEWTLGCGRPCPHRWRPLPRQGPECASAAEAGPGQGRPIAVDQHLNV